MRPITLAPIAALALVPAIAGCGSVSSAAEEPEAKPVQLRVGQAKFSRTVQDPGESATLSLTVTNTGRNPVGSLLVQLQGFDDTSRDDPREETRPRTGKDDLPNSTKRAPWFIDSAPLGGAYRSGDIFEGGSLAPGRSRTLRWELAAQQPGTHTLRYRVVGGLTDNAARATSGTGLTGSVTATIRPNATR